MVDLLVLAGIGTTIGMIVNGGVYWYYTRRDLWNVVLYVLAHLGIATLITFAGLAILTVSYEVSKLAMLAAGIYAYYYLLNKTKTFRAPGIWIKIWLTVVVINFLILALSIGFIFNLDIAVQSIVPIGGR